MGLCDLLEHTFVLAVTRLWLVYSKSCNSTHPSDLLFDEHQDLCYIEHCVLQSRPTNHT